MNFNKKQENVYNLFVIPNIIFTFAALQKYLY